MIPLNGKFYILAVSVILPTQKKYNEVNETWNEINKILLSNERIHRRSLETSADIEETIYDVIIFNIQILFS